jgi:hypothetical protein
VGSPAAKEEEYRTETTEVTEDFCR